MTRHVVFRADSAVHIGSGHIMRCLALADFLAAKGWRCTFLTRAHAGHIANQITKRSHAVSLMPAPVPVMDDWLGVDPNLERSQAGAALATLGPDWVVVDHYGLDADWTRYTVHEGVRVLIIDDLANRTQIGDLLLDQTPNRGTDDYGEQFPVGIPLLLGTGFALLHSSFTEMRSKQQLKRGSAGVGQVLLALGGMDANNITGAVIEQIKTIIGTIGLTHLDVALGDTAPHIAAVRTAIDTFPVSSTLHIGSPHMATLMAKADIAIGAGGTMAWERCCLGLPTVAISLAENQRDSLSSLKQAGAATILPPAWQDGFERALQAMADPERRFAMATRAAAMVDGQGCARVFTAMKALELNTRGATLSDALDIYHWRLTDIDPAQTLSGHTPTPAEHLEWFKTALQERSRHLLIVQDTKGAIGHVRLDISDPQTEPGPGGLAARVSITLNPDRRGAGLGASVLWAGMLHGQASGIRQFNAEIHSDNMPSQRIFARLGFTSHGTEGNFDLYQANCGGIGVPSISTEVSQR